MAFLKFSRDKRGYEHFYLVQPTNRRGKARSRVLYWFRTPPNVKVGRKPFDAEIRRALEMHNPDVSFDWAAIAETPIPPADAERWRERRRAERAIRQVAEIDTEEPAGSGEEQAHVEVEPAGAAAPAGVESFVISAEESGSAVAPAATSNPSVSAPDGIPGRGRSGRRRRRRRGRREPHATSVQVPGSEPNAQGPEVQDSGESENETPEP